MKVGDRVVCVEGHSSPDCPLKVDDIYIIADTKMCICGSISFDVGISLNPPCIGTRCGICGRDSTRDNGAWWLRSTLFRPLHFNSAHNELINQLVIEKPDILTEPIKQKL